MKARRIRLGSLVAVLALGCGGGGGGGGSILAVGGAGLAGDGGRGGLVEATTVSGGDIVVGDGEVVPLAAPDIPAPDLGENPLTIRGEVVFDPAAPFLGDDGVNPPTGLWVTGGARFQMDTSAGEMFVLGFPAGIRIDGTVECHPQLAQPPGALLSLGTSGILLVTGRIDTSGLEGGGTAANVTLAGMEGVLVRGTVLARGSDGDAGTNGGAVSMMSDGPIACSATIDTSGGRGLVGTGGGAGPVQLTAGPGQLVHYSGILTGRGGDGELGGGIGGLLALVGGDLFSSAPLVLPGGAATSDGLGGPGGMVQAITPDGRVVFTGGVTAPGGAGAGEGTGGTGGQITIRGASGPGALATLRGDIDVSGGVGPTGGAGGVISVGGQLPGSPTAPHEGPAIVMPGFTILDASGGAGSAGGGRGGTVAIFNSPLAIEEQPYMGSTLVDADLRAGGGSGGTGDGGGGGQAITQGKDLVCRDLTADGGSSREATGGAGGAAILVTMQGRVTYGSASALGGTGATAQGTPGIVIIQASEVDLISQSSTP